MDADIKELMQKVAVLETQMANQNAQMVNQNAQHAVMQQMMKQLIDSLEQKTQRFTEVVIGRDEKYDKKIEETRLSVDSINKELLRYRSAVWGAGLVIAAPLTYIITHVNEFFTWIKHL